MGVGELGRLKQLEDENQPTVAEVALTVIDAYQRRGLGTILLALGLGLQHTVFKQPAALIRSTRKAIGFEQRRSED